MNIRQIVGAVFMVAALGLIALRGDWQSVVALLILCAFAATADGISGSKNTVDTDTQSRIKDLENKMQALMLAKGLGR